MPKKPTTSSGVLSLNARALEPQGHTPQSPITQDASKPFPHRGDVALEAAPAFLTGLTTLYGAITPKRGA